MERAAWFTMVAEDAAEGELRLLYERLRVPQSGAVDNILRIHSLHPATLEAHYQLYRVVMTGSPSLPRVEREVIAVVVSALNGCHY